LVESLAASAAREVRGWVRKVEVLSPDVRRQVIAVWGGVIQL